MTAEAGESRSDRDMRWSALMAAAQDGDARAYDRLLRECLPMLRSICRARLRDLTDTEDAAQDALLTLHPVRATYDPISPFTPWISAIAERRALDRGLARSRRTSREIDIEHAGPIIDPSLPPAEHGLERAELRAALLDLPSSRAKALQLAKIEELFLSEASARSCLSVGALEVAKHRALATLRKRLGAP